MTPPLLAVVDVHKAYGRTQALRGVSLQVNRGELFGLLGPNGAGKTTLLGILAGLADADAGTVTLDGKPFTSRDHDLRRRVGLATQDLAIYPELTAAENLRFFGSLYGLRGADLKARAATMLRLAALDDRADHRAGTFSGGMKRRLNLAAALMHRPEILLLDEPTTGVDPQSRHHIFEAIKTLNADGLTVVYTSHYMEEVQALCPRLAIVDHGRVIAQDSLSSMMKHLPTTVKATPAAGTPLPQGVAVRAVRTTPAGWEIDTDDLGALLGSLPAGLTQVTVEPPTLERVFLTLTGTALRD